MTARLPSSPPKRGIIPAERIDDVAEAVLALTREVWLLTDRLTVMEQVMATHGIDLTAEIDAFVPGAAMLERLAADRRRLLGTVLTALKATP